MTDYISREAFIKWVEETYCKPCESEGRDYNHCRCGACQYDDMMRDAESFPAADVRPARTARWTEAIVAASNLYDHLGMMANIHGYVCGCCQDFSVARYNFCPNCGADMRGTDDAS